MAAEQLLLDPTDEASGTQLDVSDGTIYGLLEHAYPSPPASAIYASSVDTEGGHPAALSYQNRTVTIKVRVVGTSAADLEDRLGAVFRKVGKFQREGGTLRRVTPAGTSITFDVLPDSHGNAVFGKRYITNRVAELDLSFTCWPFGRGVAVQLADHVETTNPEIVFTETGIDGDVPALGKLVVDEDQGADQWFVMWGVQSRFYSSATSAKLVWAAAEVTALGTSTLTAGATGAFGAGSNVIRNTDLTTTYQAVASTQATGGGAHMSHVGDFVVWARVYCPGTNTGTVKLALEWAEGDFRRFTRNTEWTIDSAWESSWRLVNLGQIHLSEAAQGTQRWEGRIIAKSTTAGDEIDVNRLWLMPCTEGYGEARGVSSIASPTSVSARDEFAQTAGALSGKTLPVGGTWSGAGDADDFNVTGSGTVTRAATSDAGIKPHEGRIALAGSTNYTTIAGQVDATADTTFSTGRVGVVARYTDTSNYLAATLTPVGLGTVTLEQRVAGTTTTLATGLLGAIRPGENYRVLVVVDTAGRVWMYAGLSARPLQRVLSAQSSALATGGALATGLVGFFDAYVSGIASTRTFDNFLAFTGVAPDAAVFASQSLELRHDQVLREDSGGTLWGPVSDYRGRHLLIPPAGQEGRTTRIVVKASRNDPDAMNDPSADDISARLTVTPRYLQVPDA